MPQLHQLSLSSSHQPGNSIFLFNAALPASAPALFAFGKTASQHLANWHPHPPSSPSAKQDHSIFLLTGTSSIMTISSYLSGHAITPCPTSYL
jgi:hypothetical protein